MHSVGLAAFLLQYLLQHSIQTPASFIKRVAFNLQLGIKGGLYICISIFLHDRLSKNGCLLNCSSASELYPSRHFWSLANNWLNGKQENSIYWSVCMLPLKIVLWKQEKKQPFNQRVSHSLNRDVCLLQNEQKKEEERVQWNKQKTSTFLHKSTVPSLRAELYVSCS